MCNFPTFNEVHKLTKYTSQVQSFLDILMQKCYMLKLYSWNRKLYKWHYCWRRCCSDNWIALRFLQSSSTNSNKMWPHSSIQSVMETWKQDCQLDLITRQPSMSGKISYTWQKKRNSISFKGTNYSITITLGNLNLVHNDKLKLNRLLNASPPLYLCLLLGSLVIVTSFFWANCVFRM